MYGCHAFMKQFKKWKPTGFMAVLGNRDGRDNLKVLRENVESLKFCVTFLGQRLLCGSGAWMGLVHCAFPVET